MKKIALFLLGSILMTSQLMAQKENTLDKGYKLYEEGEFKKALNVFENYLKENPKSSEAYYLKGVCHSNLNKNKEAINDYSKALELDPTYAEAWYERGYSYFILGDMKNAMENFLQTIEVEPNYAEAYLNIGTIYFENDQYDLACENWIKAKSLGLSLAQQVISTYCE
jgi:Flp pilus assembly protein TadD